MVLISLSLLVLLNGAPAHAPQARAGVYVSEFVSRNMTDPLVLASFTDLFETELVNTDQYRVLNRRNLHRLLAETKNEAFVTSMGDLPEQTRARAARLEGAWGVVFGEVTDDAESGEVVVTVTLESFDSRKHWKKSSSMKRGLVRDLSSRQAAMKQLVAAIVVEASPAGEAGSAAPSLGTFENDFLKVTVEGAALAADGRHASIVLRFANKTDAEEFLSTECCPGASMTDSNMSNRWNFDYNASSGLVYQSYFRSGDRYRSEDLANMTRLAPLSHHTVVLTFYGSDLSTSRPSRLSFSLPVFRRRGGDVQRLTVGVANIPLASK